jgi:hypothetical protein
MGHAEDVAEGSERLDDLGALTWEVRPRRALGRAVEPLPLPAACDSRPSDPEIGRGRGWIRALSQARPPRQAIAEDAALLADAYNLIQVTQQLPPRRPPPPNSSSPSAREAESEPLLRAAP